MQRNESWKGKRGPKISSNTKLKRLLWNIPSSSSAASISTMPRVSPDDHLTTWRRVSNELRELEQNFPRSHSALWSHWELNCYQIDVPLWRIIPPGGSTGEHNKQLYEGGTLEPLLFHTRCRMGQRHRKDNKHTRTAQKTMFYYEKRKVGKRSLKVLNVLSGTTTASAHLNMSAVRWHLKAAGWRQSSNHRGSVRKVDLLGFVWALPLTPTYYCYHLLIKCKSGFSAEETFIGFIFICNILYIDLYRKLHPTQMLQTFMILILSFTSQ